MSLSRLQQHAWISAVLRVLMLCFVLGTLAHAGHRHDQDSSHHAQQLCEYCTGFAGMMDAPVSPALITPVTTAIHVAIVPLASVSLALVGLAQARAPPAR